MIATVSANPFIFGIPEKPKPLPRGWEYLAKRNAFLKAKSPDGREWFVTRLGVVRCYVVKPEEERRFAYFRAGDEFVDDAETFTFSGWGAVEP